MKPPISTPRAWLLVFAATFAAAGAIAIPSASGADPNERTDELRARDAELRARSGSALLELYALESRLARARTEAAVARARAAALARERAAVRERIGFAREALRRAELLLAERLRALYRHGETDALEILLGATSIDEAVTGLDGLTFAARQDRVLITQTRAAKRRLRTLDRKLSVRSDALRALASATAARAASLEAAHAARASYVERLARERKLNAAAIAQLEQRAAAARARSQRISAAAPAAAPATATPAADPVTEAAPAAAASTATASRTLTVVATGYAIVGRTASGVPTGWGVVAVDPSVIPLGTRMTIPGYGEGVAADTGGALRGATIDVWFPTRAQALAWGRRTVVVTLH